MRDKLLSIHHRLLQRSTFQTYRYLFNAFNTNSRLTGLIGPRGTGKTTLLLQYINEKIERKNQCIYLSLDHIYFTRTRLVDFVDDLYEIDGIRYFFLDEVHKYRTWNQEIKNIYDSFPDVTIVFSGSSSLNLIKGTHDLSRRGAIFKLCGMSFREYLEFRFGKAFPAMNLETLLEKPETLIRELSETRRRRLKGHFLDYLNAGYYPFVFEDEANFHQKLLNVIDKTIYEDITNFYKLKTENLVNFKKIIAYLATIPPGELSRNSISKHIRLDNKTVNNYLNILRETGLVRLIREKKSGSGLLKAAEKIYLDNTNIYKAVVDDTGFAYNKGTVREIFFINMLENAGEKVHFSRTGDFQVRGHHFEIGGKNKTRRQIKSDLGNSWLVKDDVLHAGAHVLPLHLFGFLY